MTSSSLPSLSFRCFLPNRDSWTVASHFSNQQRGHWLIEDGSSAPHVSQAPRFDGTSFCSIELGCEDEDGNELIEGGLRCFCAAFLSDLRAFAIGSSVKCPRGSRLCIAVTCRTAGSTAAAPLVGGDLRCRWCVEVGPGGRRARHFTAIYRYGNSVGVPVAAPKRRLTKFGKVYR